MATQYSYNDYLKPEFEYQAEELQKRLQFSMANFAQLRFKRAMQMRLAVVENNK